MMNKMPLRSLFLDSIRRHLDNIIKRNPDLELGPISWHSSMRILYGYTSFEGERNIFKLISLVRGIRDGVIINCDETRNGQSKTSINISQWKNDMLNGDYISFFNNKMTMKCFYYNNEKFGPNEEFMGDISHISYYIEDKIFSKENYIKSIHDSMMNVIKTTSLISDLSKIIIQYLYPLNNLNI